MSSVDVLSTQVLRHGAYLCLRPRPGADAGALAAAPVPELVRRLGLAGEFDSPGAPHAVAFLRRHAARPGAIADDGVLDAAWVVHVASPESDRVRAFTEEAAKRLAAHADVRVLGGVVRPRDYTSGAMERWAYGRAVGQARGEAMPNGFLIPMSKTAAWWGKGWMERHTYFLPRYDDAGRMIAEGHALAAEAGIPCIMRRTYKALEHPAPDGAYDFVTYFECADTDVPVFEAVCAALRDVGRNPEWAFVREGPTWHGRRVVDWPALFAPPR